MYFIKDIISEDVLNREELEKKCQKYPSRTIFLVSIEQRRGIADWDYNSIRYIDGEKIGLTTDPISIQSRDSGKEFRFVVKL